MWNSLASYYTCYRMNVMYNDPLALCSYAQIFGNCHFIVSIVFRVLIHMYDRAIVQNKLI